MIPNVLASRYASEAITGIWSEKGKVLLEREFWLAVLKAQKEIGIPVPSEAIEAYEKVKNDINLEQIREKEKKLRHDVKSRIEVFNELSGWEHIHKGLTSRDLTDNVEQYQILNSMKVIRLKVIRSLEMLAEKSDTYKKLVISGRTHNVPAQPITLGKRFAMFGQEVLFALENLSDSIDRYALRGVKGAVGTLLDIKTLLGDDFERLESFQERVASHLGFKKVLNAVGQVYPRSMDFEVISCLHQIGAGFSSFCKTLRIMAGHELISEGFQKGQVGSSAMPHKMNSRNCERVNGFHTILSGFVAMTAGLAGDQWNEGDVSCSVVRRVVLPDAFFAIDGLLETVMVILSEMKVSEKVINQETARYLPFLISTTFLMEAVKAGMGREKAHSLIKKYAHEVMEDLREGNIQKNDFIHRLGQDPEFPLSETELNVLLSSSEMFLGESVSQVERFSQAIASWTLQFPEALRITPGELI